MHVGKKFGQQPTELTRRKGKKIRHILFICCYTGNLEFVRSVVWQEDCCCSYHTTIYRFLHIVVMVMTCESRMPIFFKVHDGGS
jgi:hypothetical protein